MHHIIRLLASGVRGALFVLLAAWTGGICAAKNAAAPVDLAPVWNYVTFGNDVGEQGLIENVGPESTEIYATARDVSGHHYWYSMVAVSSRPEDGVRHNFVSESFYSSLQRLLMLTTQGRRQLIAATADGRLVRYDAASKQIVERLDSPCVTRLGLMAIAAGDLDRDGNDDLLYICGDQSLRVSLTGGGDWSLTGIRGTRIAAAQMDDDSALEVVTNAGFVVDGMTHSVQWFKEGGFGEYLLASDIDGDGRAELIAAASWSTATAYDVESQTPKWVVNGYDAIGSIAIADADGDGVQELLIAYQQTGAIVAHRLTTGVEVGRMLSRQPSVSELLVTDLNRDGVPELVYGAGKWTSEPDRLVVSRWGAVTPLWLNVSLGGPFVGPVKGDLDGDGVDEVVFASSRTGDNLAGRILILDSRDLSLRAISVPVFDGHAGGDCFDLALVDVDGDGRLDIVVAGGVSGLGALEVYRFSRHARFTRTWQLLYAAPGPFRAVVTGDADADGKLDILGVSDGYVFAFDAATGLEKWISTPRIDDIYPRDLAMADFDGDGRMEVMQQTELANKTYIFDGPGHVLEGTLVGSGAAMATRPTGTGALLVTADSLGWVTESRLVSGVYQPVLRWRGAPAAIQAMAVSPGGNTWIASNGVMYAYNHRQELRYQSARLGGTPGHDVVRLRALGMELVASDRGLHGLPSPAR